ncbi:MAG: mechanosensitive ion channel family protein [Gammaproteobacteria bacterium]|nr:mechanosensitive ion channel family protein [Gammaproteobacteria bacterium]
MQLIDFYPLIIVLLIAAVVFLLITFIFNRRISNNSSVKYYRQLTYNLYLVILLIAVIAASPIESELKGQILSLIGIVISGAIALSSTTLLGNTLAGVLLKVTKSFRSGDFISVNDYTGKVASRSLLNIEIQTFDRGLIFLPNVYLIQNPMKVFPKSGLFISVEVSLGYDVQRTKVEKALLSAAEKLGIENAYVEIKGLLDFSVQYALHALVTNLESYMSIKSKLHAMVIDELHHSDIEIVSPNFMNTRALSDTPVIPESIEEKTELEKALDENIDAIIFDKANHADKLEVLQQKKERVLKLLSKESDDSSRAERLRYKLEVIDKAIEKIKREIDLH